MSEMLLAGLAGGMQGLEGALEKLRARIKETNDKKEKGELLQKYYQSMVDGGMSPEEAQAEASNVALGGKPGSVGSIQATRKDERLAKIDAAKEHLLTQQGIDAETTANRNKLEFDGPPEDVDPDDDYPGKAYFTRFMETHETDMAVKNANIGAAGARQTASESTTDLRNLQVEDVKTSREARTSLYPTNMDDYWKLREKADKYVLGRVSEEQTRHDKQQELIKDDLKEWREDKKYNKDMPDDEFEADHGEEPKPLDQYDRKEQVAYYKKKWLEDHLGTDVTWDLLRDNITSIHAPKETAGESAPDEAAKNFEEGTGLKLNREIPKGQQGSMPVGSSEINPNEEAYGLETTSEYTAIDVQTAKEALSENPNDQYWLQIKQDMIDAGAWK